METLLSVLLYSIHVILPLVSILIIYYCFQSLKNHQRNNQPLIMLINRFTKEKIPVVYWENSIGRSKNSDIVLNGITVSRDHAVLFRREQGWIISDTNSKTGVKVNGKSINGNSQVYINDIIDIGGVKLLIKKSGVNGGDKNQPFFNNKKISKTSSSFLLLLLVTFFHFLACIQVCFANDSFNYMPIVPFIALIGISWIYFFITRYGFRRVGFELEAIGIFLSGIGIITISGVNVSDTYMQIISLGIGMFAFSTIISFIKNPDIAMKWRPYVAAIAILLFLVNLVFGRIRNGAQNWIFIGPVSMQPSEIIKIAFVFVGASTLERLQTAKNLTEFIVFSGICMGSLFLMGDFGTACIFFITFIIISFMRSGSIRTIVLICSAAAIGALMVLKFKPYVNNRFMVWRHAWDHVNDMGYQQTRVMTYSASGGLLGIGIGKGCLKYVFASVSDLVFGMVCEEWGLIIALSAVICIMLIAFYAARVSFKSRSTFYSIASCAAAGTLVFQTCLNVFGAVDILPLTGVTFPFLSMGGSSMISTWGLLAFIKASDERTYAQRG